MALTLTAGAPPIFLTKNYFSADANLYGGTFAVSSGLALAPRAYDMDPFAYWLTSGENNDATTSWIRSALWEGYAQATRTIAFFAILNHNLKNFVVEYSINNGSSWVTLVTVTGATAANYLYDCSASPITGVTDIKVSATLTQTTNQEKQIGTIVACNYLYQVTRPPDRLVRRYISNVRVVDLADGSQDITRIKRSPASHQFYGCDMNWTLLPDADRDALRTVDRTNPSFCIMPEPGDRLGDLFYGRFEGDWQDEPTDEYKASGNNLNLVFREISS